MCDGSLAEGIPSNLATVFGPSLDSDRLGTKPGELGTSIFLMIGASGFKKSFPTKKYSTPSLWVSTSPFLALTQPAFGFWGSGRGGTSFVPSP